MSDITIIVSAMGGGQPSAGVAPLEVPIQVSGGRQAGGDTLPGVPIINAAGNGYVMNASGGYVLYGA